MYTCQFVVSLSNTPVSSKLTHTVISEEETVILDSKVIPGMGELMDMHIDQSVINTLAPTKVRDKPGTQKHVS